VGEDSRWKKQRGGAFTEYALRVYTIKESRRRSTWGKAKKANGTMQRPMFTFAQGYTPPAGYTILLFLGRVWSRVIFNSDIIREDNLCQN
jgi:hypothetical protein